MTTLLLAAHDAGTLSQHTGKAVSAAQQLGAPIHLLVAGNGAASAARAAAALQGVDKVLVAEAPVLAASLAEPLAELIVSLAPAYTAIVSPATSTGKAVLPRVAARLDVMQVSDVIEVVSPDTFKRPTYAGNAIATVQNPEPVKVLTVRTGAFVAAPTGGAAPIETLAWDGTCTLSSFVSESAPQSDRPDLSTARFVVAGGRAFGSKENFERLLVPLADKLGAALGASRAAVDAGYAPNELQVGQTGKIVTPDLYIAVGISGAIQHLAGIKGAKVIVAINKDADAPIFQIADYGLVGDLFALLPELERAL